MKQYKFESWFNGDVTLIYSEVLYKKIVNEKIVNGKVVIEKKGKEKKIKEDIPVFVTWDNFAESEATKIKQMQKHLFEEKVRINLEKFKAEFTKRYSKHLMPKDYLEMEKQECANILFSKIPNKELILTKNWKIPFSYNDLLDIQEYAKRTILRGMDIYFDFIHSPNNKYQVKDKIPSQVYAQLLYEYYNWLNSSFKSDEDNLLINIEKINIDSLWFKVGLFFANGQISQLIENYKNFTMPNFTAISKELGNINYRPYISESINNTNISDKNIFSNNRKVQTIIKYCEINNIIISEDFKNRIKI
jgi:hypothetical protein